MKNAFLCSFALSPSMRREWIEKMFLLAFSPETQTVSLHAEGVD